jgi:hypothetical protein
VPLEQTGQVEPLQEEADQGSGADLLGLQADVSRQSRDSHDDLTTGGRVRVRGR